MRWKDHRNMSHILRCNFVYVFSRDFVFDIQSCERFQLAEHEKYSTKHEMSIRSCKMSKISCQNEMDHALPCCTSPPRQPHYNPFMLLPLMRMCFLCHYYCRWEFSQNGKLCAAFEQNFWIIQSEHPINLFHCHQRAKGEGKESVWERERGKCVAHLASYVYF